MSQNTFNTAVLINILKHVDCMPALLVKSYTLEKCS